MASHTEKEKKQKKSWLLLQLRPIAVQRKTLLSAEQFNDALKMLLLEDCHPLPYRSSTDGIMLRSTMAIIYIYVHKASKQFSEGWFRAWEKVCLCPNVSSALQANIYKRIHCIRMSLRIRMYSQMYLSKVTKSWSNASVIRCFEASETLSGLINIIGHRQNLGLEVNVIRCSLGFKKEQRLAKCVSVTLVCFVCELCRNWNCCQLMITALT